ncbi:MAG: NAD(P)/FAD-dependent oxidoreductase [Sinobacteraceae bacterium]|nr:NAD(P)/FAD-dependent oxidoreductase [Nevskiaceae bacterium]
MQDIKGLGTQSPKSSADVIVVGAGHNGLVAACYLARGGLDVLVVEAHDTPGGMTATNPMAPEAPEHLINEASIHASLFRMSSIDTELELSSKFGLRQRLIDPCHVQLNPDGDESLALWRDPMKTAEEMRYFSPKDAKAWIELANLLDTAVKIGLPIAMTNITKPGWRVISKVLLAALGKLRYWGSMFSMMTNTFAGLIEETFEHPMNRAPFATALPFMDFKSDLSAFAMIYLGVLQRYGIAMFEGGTGAFPKALIRCLEASGGQVRTRAPVKNLIVSNGRVTGVRLYSGEELSARKAVLTAFSPKSVLNHLLPAGTLPDKLAKRAARIPTSNRGIADYKLNIALKGKVQFTRHQAWRNKRDGLDLRLPTTQWATHDQAIQAFDDCVRGEVPQMIPGLAQITTAFDPNMAPPGHDTFWFWSGLVPFNPHIGWDQARDLITQRVIKDTAKYLDGIEELEIARRPLAPPDIEKRFWAIDGNVYHVDPYITRFGAGRPAMGFAGYKTPVPGLFLSGSGTHPSAGICGLPGRNAALTLLAELRKQ